MCGASTNGLIGTHLIPAAFDCGIPEVKAAGLLALMGIFDLAGTTDANFIQKFKSDGPYAVVLNITRTVQFASFNGDFDEIEINVAVPGATMVTFTTPFMSNGVPTLY